MINIEHLSFSYQDKEIFKDTSFKAFPGNLTVVLGKSGIGKSTLLNIIAKKIDYSIVVDVHTVGYMKQNPELLYNMNMRDQAAMLENIYQRRLDFSLLDRFNLSQTLDNYPSSLSGGEKLRWGLVLNTMFQPDILLCDEPTASLDWKQKAEIIQYLKEYAHSGKTVIVATHDEDFIDEADLVYTISNRQLIIDKDCSVQKAVNSSQVSYSFKKIGSSLFKTLKYHKLQGIFSYILLAFSIVLMCLVFKFGSHITELSVYSTSKNLINEIIVYKPWGGKSDHSFSYVGYEAPFDQDELELLTSTKHVASVQARYDQNYSSRENNPLSEESATLFDMPLAIVKNGQVFNISAEENGINTITCHSYNTGSDYKDNIQIQYNNENGIYLSRSLYNLISRLYGDDLEGTSLQFKLHVPVYSGNGGGIMNGDEDIMYEFYSAYGDDVEITVPVSGVLEDTKMGIADPGDVTSFCFFIPDDLISQYIAEYHDSETHSKCQVTTLHEDGSVAIEEYTDYIPEDSALADDQFIAYVYYYYPYQGHSYNIYLDDITSMNEVCASLEDQGFHVISSLEKQQSSFVIDLVKDSFGLVACLFIVIIFIIYLVIQYLNRNDLNRFRSYFLSVFKTEKSASRIVHRYLFVRTAALIVITALMLGLTVSVILGSTYFRLSSRDILMIPIIVIISFIYEYLFPLISGGHFHD